MNMKEIEDILVKRDKCKKYEAEHIVRECMNDIQFIATHGGTLEEIEDLVRDELGLEPDYIPALLGYE